MEIKFEQQGLLYVAEFEVASNCNLHIERESRGAFTIAQRGTKQGKYAYITDENYDNRTIIDVDMLGNIYPKYIKITSASKPTYAEVNFAEQGGGGIDPNDPESEYFTEYFNYSDMSALQELIVFGLAEFKINGENDGLKIAPAGMIIMHQDEMQNMVQLSFRPNAVLYSPEGELTVKDIMAAAGFLEVYNSIPRITKEEFYNLEV